MAAFVAGPGIPYTATPHGGSVELGRELHQPVQIVLIGRSDLLHRDLRTPVAVDRGQDRSSSS
jgi:hypothetical protein